MSGWFGKLVEENSVFSLHLPRGFDRLSPTPKWPQWHEMKWIFSSLKNLTWVIFWGSSKRCHSTHCVLKKTYHLMPGGKWRDSGWLPCKVGFSSGFVCSRMCPCAKCAVRVLGVTWILRYFFHWEGTHFIARHSALNHGSTKVLRKCEWKMETAVMERDRYWVSICLSAEGLRLRSVICVSVQMAG